MAALRDAPRRSARRPIVPALLGALLAACAGEPAEVAPPEPSLRVRPAPTATRRIEPAAPPQPGFCHTLRAVIAAEGEDYRTVAGDGDPSLATAPDSPFRRLASCRVSQPEDGALRAAYQCRSPAYADSAVSAVDDLYTRLDAAVGACLMDGDWPGRTWRRAPDLGFATLERQALWADQASWPRSVVTLKVEPDTAAARPDYRVRLEVSRASGRSLW
ncbi:hypothetical protein [Marinivivus vitaminiproducens]|uniref:hypothetical protein n=1 Tax=Marinivivus vitaminiproducens TaxID=3035935 RepID=UPI0027A9AC08|nr:hypothetical protein P4R82_23000 [Geminicoccaceae bacterium SCSIO 64248]